MIRSSYDDLAIGGRFVSYAIVLIPSIGYHIICSMSPALVARCLDLYNVHSRQLGPNLHEDPNQFTICPPAFLCSNLHAILHLLEFTGNPNAVEVPISLRWSQFGVGLPNWFDGQAIRATRSSVRTIIPMKSPIAIIF